MPISPTWTKAADLASHVKTEQVPAKVKAAGAVTSLSALSGIASVDLVKGEQLVDTRFAAVAESAACCPDEPFPQPTAAAATKQAMAKRYVRSMWVSHASV